MALLVNNKITGFVAFVANLTSFFGLAATRGTIIDTIPAYIISVVTSITIVAVMLLKIYRHAVSGIYATNILGLKFDIFLVWLLFLGVDHVNAICIDTIKF